MTEIKVTEIFEPYYKEKRTRIDDEKDVIVIDNNSDCIYVYHRVTDMYWCEVIINKRFGTLSLHHFRCTNHDVKRYTKNALEKGCRVFTTVDGMYYTISGDINLVLT